MTRDEAVAWLSKEVPHYDCEDCWYSCATLTCDDHRKSDKCDCGADAENAKRAEVAAMFSGEAEGKALALIRRVRKANIIFPYMCANNTDAYTLLTEMDDLLSSDILKLDAPHK